MGPGGSKSSARDCDGSGVGGGKTKDESRAGRAGMATGAIGSSDARRGNVADVGDVCTDFRRKNVEMGVVAWMSVSCDQVSLPRLDNLPLGEDRSPRVLRALGEGRGEVDGAYHIINVNKLSRRNLLPCIPWLICSHRTTPEGSLYAGSVQEETQRASAPHQGSGSVAAGAYRGNSIRAISVFAMT